MSKKVTFEEAKLRLFEKHGNNINLLKYDRMGDYALFECTICSNKWETKAASVIITGTGCNICCREKMGPKKYNFEIIKKLVEDEGYELLTNEYKDCHSPLFIKFDCGHIQKTTLHSFLDGHRCEICAKRNNAQKRKIPEEMIMNKMNEFGFTFLKFPNGYNNQNSKIEFLCKMGHTNTQWVRTFLNHPDCKECRRVVMAQSKYHSYEYIKEYVESQECDLVSKEYVGCKDVLEVKFPCGHICSIIWGDFLSGHRCRICGINKRIELSRTPVENIYKFLEENNFKFISFPNGYSGNKSRIIFMCELGHSIETSVSSLLKNKACRKCSKIKWSLEYRGENANNWNGGFSNVYLELKGRMIEWRKLSLKKCNYQCVFTKNKRNLEVHHLYGFNLIFKECIENLNIENKGRTIADYPVDELLTILNELKRLHLKYGEGICIARDLHHLFHKIFGKKNNLPEQFVKFTEMIDSGEIDISKYIGK
jgi:hypothetical protein